MNKKTILFVIVAVVLGALLGSGGTLAAERAFFKTSATGTVAKTPGPLLPLGEFTVNLQGGSFLKTSITLEVADSKSETELQAQEAFLMDRVNTVLANKSLSDVQTAEARENLRKDLLKQLNQVAGNKVNDVLFISFVYQ